MRFEAAIHGVDLDKETKKEPKQGASSPDFFKFGDPDEYKKMPKKEREAITQKMMAQHKNTMRQQRNG